MKIYDPKFKSKDDITYTWPEASGAGYLYNDGAGVMSWDAAATPEAAGSDKQIQFNDGGTMGADAGFTYYKNMKSAWLTGGLLIQNSGTGTLSGGYGIASAINATGDGGAIVPLWLDYWWDTAGVTGGISYIEGNLLSCIIQNTGVSGEVLGDFQWIKSRIEIDSPFDPTPGQGTLLHHSISTSAMQGVTSWIKGLVVSTNTSGPTDKLYGIQIGSGGGPIGTAAYGLYIGDHSLLTGTGSKYNIYSAGAASKNKFEGDVTIGGDLDIGLTDTKILYSDGGKVSAADGAIWDKNYHVLFLSKSLDAGSALSSGPLFLGWSYNTSSGTGETVWGITNSLWMQSGVTHDQSYLQGAWHDIGWDGNANLGVLLGEEFDITAGGTGTISYVFGIDMMITPGSSASVAEAIGYRSQFSDWFEPAGSITDFYHIKLLSPVLSGNGTITNLYGLYIEDQTDAAVTGNNFNLYSAGANSKNFFGGYGYFGSTPASHYFSVPQLSVINTDGDLTSIFIGSSGPIGINSVAWNSSMGGFGIVTSAVSTEDGSQAIGTISAGYVLKKDGLAYGIQSYGFIDDQLGEIPSGVAIGSSPNTVIKSVNNYNVWASDVRGLDVGEFSSFEQSGSGTLSIENYYGISIRRPSVYGTVGIDNVYGFYIEDYSSLSASGSNYNIYSAGATSQNVFEGDMIIGGDVDVSTGFISISGSDKQVLFNDAGVIGGSNNLTYDIRWKSLNVSNSIGVTGGLFGACYVADQTQTGDACTGTYQGIIVHDIVGSDPGIGAIGAVNMFVETDYTNTGVSGESLYDIWANIQLVCDIDAPPKSGAIWWNIRAEIYPRQGGADVRNLYVRTPLAGGDFTGTVRGVNISTSGDGTENLLVDSASLWIEDTSSIVTSGAAAMYNLYSAGLTSKSLFQGTLYVQKNIGGTKTFEVVGVITKTDTGDPAYGYEGLMCINTFDNNVKVYGDGAWRTIASGW